MTSRRRSSGSDVVGWVGGGPVSDEEFEPFEHIYADDHALRAERVKAVFPIATPY